eukprot:TRINITY_DN685_c0_g1_i1.p1 TRINITY_DN685_c0_g1~~TRINITY_DN685_c0_g1_i1.p1  ORF type:complete len:101 (-),score=13.52 TRINITY_DN685_c0_g1_i1:129-431(-)
MSVYSRTATHGLADAKKADNADDDAWDTDPDYVNDIPEKDTRWGSKIIQPQKGAVLGAETPNLVEFAKQVQTRDDNIRSEQYNSKRVLYGGERAEKSEKD